MAKKKTNKTPKPPSNKEQARTAALSAQAAQDKIDSLIDEFAKQLDDDSYLEALEEMEDRARTSRVARMEELGRK